jgi:roadblock/LC7 domain-containing protein
MYDSVYQGTTGKAVDFILNYMSAKGRYFNCIVDLLVFVKNTVATVNRIIWDIVFGILVNRRN